jgi:ABC-type transport system involved in multi-copper enzyme maturation permease subunit
VANDTPVPLNRIERILRNMIASAAGLSILAILATILATFARIDLNQGVWPVVVVLPFVGLTIAFVLIVAFLIVSVVRRRRLARDGD